MFHSTAYVNGTVYTMESEGDKCSAFVVQDGKFVYCGSDEEAKKLADEVVDLHGAAVLPGMIDTHQHLLAYASGLAKLNLKAAKSLEQLKQMLHDYAKDELPDARKVLLERGHLVIPIFVLIFVLIGLNASVIKAAIWAIYSTILCTFLRKSTRLTPEQFVAGFADGAKQAVGLIAACATAGIIIGVLNLTGTGLKFASGIIALSGGILPGMLELRPDGLPVRWSAEKGWVMDITYDDGNPPLPYKFKLTHPDGYSAILPVKDRQKPNAAFRDDQLALELPAGTIIEPIKKGGN